MELQKLTPAEISNLWNTYVTNTMGIWATRHFIEKAQDEEIKKMLEFTEVIAVEEARQSKLFLEEAGQPLPTPFEENDVNVNAKPLFTDVYVVLLNSTLTQAAMSVYALSLNTTTRADIRAFFSECIDNTKELFNRCADIIVDKGLQQSDIHLQAPKYIEKVESQSYIQGWFTDRRPINAQEIGQIIYNYHSTEVHKEFINGASRVAKTKELKKTLSVV